MTTVNILEAIIQRKRLNNGHKMGCGIELSVKNAVLSSHYITIFLWTKDVSKRANKYTFGNYKVDFIN